MSASTSERWRTRRPWPRARRELRLGLVDRGRDDQLHARPQVRRIVPDARIDALGAQLLDRRGRAIAARDRAAVPAQHARDARHAGSADPHAGAARRSRASRARRRSSRATAAAASGRATLRMPARIAARRPGSPRSSRDARAQPRAVERGVLDDHRTAGGGEMLALRVLMVARGMGIGYEQRGQAGRRELPDGAARAAHAEVGGGQHRPEAVARRERRGSARAAPSRPRSRARGRACR